VGTIGSVSDTVSSITLLQDVAPTLIYTCVEGPQTKARHGLTLTFSALSCSAAGLCVVSPRHSSSCSRLLCGLTPYLASPPPLPSSVRKTPYVADWEANRQDEIKQLTSAGIIPHEHELKSHPNKSLQGRSWLCVRRRCLTSRQEL